jgi:hypothetical protein
VGIEDVLEGRKQLRPLDRQKVPSQPNKMPPFTLIEIFARNNDRYLCRSKLNFQSDGLSIIGRADIGTSSAFPAHNILIDHNRSRLGSRISV